MALIFSGQYVRYVAGLRRAWSAAGAAVVDPWGKSLQLLMGGVVASGLGMLGCFRFMETRVINDPDCMSEVAVRKTKTKTKMSMGESFKFLCESKYIRNLAVLVIAYGATDCRRPLCYCRCAHCLGGLDPALSCSPPRAQACRLTLSK